jgi:hypothetical protein
LEVVEPEWLEDSPVDHLREQEEVERREEAWLED